MLFYIETKPKKNLTSKCQFEANFCFEISCGKKFSQNLHFPTKKNWFQQNHSLVG